MSKRPTPKVIDRWLDSPPTPRSLSNALNVATGIFLLLLVVGMWLASNAADQMPCKIGDAIAGHCRLSDNPDVSFALPRSL